MQSASAKLKSLPRKQDAKRPISSELLCTRPFWRYAAIHLQKHITYAIHLASGQVWQLISKAKGRGQIEIQTRPQERKMHWTNRSFVIYTKKKKKHVTWVIPPCRAPVTKRDQRWVDTILYLYTSLSPTWFTHSHSLTLQYSKNRRCCKGNDCDNRWCTITG